MIESDFTAIGFSAAIMLTVVLIIKVHRRRKGWPLWILVALLCGCAPHRDSFVSQTGYISTTNRETHVITEIGTNYVRRWRPTKYEPGIGMH